MLVRVAAIGAGLALCALAFYHPATPPAFSSVAPSSQPAFGRHAAGRRGARASAPSEELVVYVAGDVAHPGLYHLAPDARVVDAIARAGGQRLDAQPGAVNLAAKPSDGDEIYVPRAGEAISPGRSTRPSRAKRRRKTPRTSGSAAMPNGAAAVDVNLASEQDLAGVPGIGPTIAVRIVRLRELDGPYATFDELLDVAGMTQARLDRAQPFLRDPSAPR